MERLHVSMPAENPAKVPTTSQNQLPTVWVNETSVASAPGIELHSALKSSSQGSELHGTQASHPHHAMSEILTHENNK